MICVIIIYTHLFRGGKNEKTTTDRAGVPRYGVGPAVVEASLFLASRGLWWDSAFLGYIKGGKHDEKKKYETA